MAFQFIIWASFFLHHCIGTVSSTPVQNSIIYAKLPSTPFGDHLSKLINRISEVDISTQSKLNQSYIPKILFLSKELKKLKSSDNEDKDHKLQYIQSQLDTLLLWRNEPLYYSRVDTGENERNRRSPRYISKGSTVSLSERSGIANNAIPLLNDKSDVEVRPFLITLVSHPVNMCYGNILDRLSKKLGKQDDIDDILRRMIENPLTEKENILKLNNIIKTTLKNEDYESLTIDHDTLHQHVLKGYGCSNIQWHLLHPHHSFENKQPHANLELDRLMEGDNNKLTPLLVLSQFDLVLVADHDLASTSSNVYLKSLTTLQLQMSLSFTEVLEGTSPSSSIVYETAKSQLQVNKSHYTMLDQLFPLLRPYLLKINSLDLELYEIAINALDIHRKHIDKRSKRRGKQSTTSDWMPAIVSIYGDVGADPTPLDEDCPSTSLFRNVLNVLYEFYHQDRTAFSDLHPHTLHDVHPVKQIVPPPFFTYTQQELDDAQ